MTLTPDWDSAARKTCSKLSVIGTLSDFDDYELENEVECLCYTNIEVNVERGFCLRRYEKRRARAGVFVRRKYGNMWEFY